MQKTLREAISSKVMVLTGGPGTGKTTTTLGGLSDSRLSEKLVFKMEGLQ